MCDQLPIELCEQLTPEELMALEFLRCERDNVAARSTVATFLKDTMNGAIPAAKPGDRLKAAQELMRIGYGLHPDDNPRKPKITSKDLIRLGYGCTHAAD